MHRVTAGPLDWERLAPWIGNGSPPGSGLCGDVRRMHGYSATRRREHDRRPLSDRAYGHRPSCSCCPVSALGERVTELPAGTCHIHDGVRVTCVPIPCRWVLVNWSGARRGPARTGHRAVRGSTQGSVVRVLPGAHVERLRIEGGTSATRSSPGSAAGRSCSRIQWPPGGSTSSRCRDSTEHRWRRM
jgi:hypothetical protein